MQHIYIINKTLKMLENKGVERDMANKKINQKLIYIKSVKYGLFP